MAVYRPGTEERDQTKINMSLQAIGAQVDTNTSNITTLQGQTSGYESAWTAYSPTVSAQAGTITTYSATGRSKTIGKTVLVQVDIALTNVGSATGALFITTPATPAAFYNAGTVFEYNSTGKSGAALVDHVNNRFSSRDASGTSWFVSGYKIAATIVYERT